MSSFVSLQTHIFCSWLSSGMLTLCAAINMNVPQPSQLRVPPAIVLERSPDLRCSCPSVYGDSPQPRMLKGTSKENV